MRIGIFGGSFNPVHQQHIRMARTCRISQNLDEIWFMPVFQPVHKPGLELFDFDSRCRLVEKALAGHEKMQVTRVEKQLGGPSYTVLTLEFLQRHYPEHQFYLIIGGDSCRDLHTWKEIDRLCAMTEFIVVDRPGINTDQTFAKAILHRVECSLSEVSSSLIRSRLVSHDFLISELHPKVLYEILRHDMYGCLGDAFKKLLSFIEKKLLSLPVGLINHIEGVAELACNYAIQCGYDPRVLLIAGLAHDLFRIADADEIARLAKLSGCELSDLEVKMPMLAHGVAAVQYLKSSGLHLPDGLLEAIRWHTSPDENIAELGKILVVADLLEPSRRIAEHDELRNADIDFPDLYKKVLQIKSSRRKN